jgi:Ser/Thr protein kinase RdoA (MazF antagonist)
MERAGRMTAELHAIVQRIGHGGRPRPRWDAKRLHAAVEELRPHHAGGRLPAHVWDLVLDAEAGCATLMPKESAKGRFGLIHADLGVQNFVFHNRQVSPIDFCSCGYGYFAFDLAQILMLAPRQSFWHALMRGYASEGGSMEEGTVRRFAGMSFILWLNAHAPTSFKNIQERLDAIAMRVRELLAG